MHHAASKHARQFVTQPVRMAADSATLEGLDSCCGFLRIIRGFADIAKHRGSRSKMKTTASDLESEDQEQEFKPLTAQEVQEWRRRNPAASMLRPVWFQMVAGVVVALVAWLVTGSLAIAGSVAYGAMAVAIPAAFMACLLARAQAKVQVSAAMLSLMLGEILKVVLTVVLLCIAPLLVVGLNWLALVAGVVVAINMYWVAFLVPSRSDKRVDLNKS